MMALPVLGAVIVNSCMGTAYTWSIFLTAFEQSLLVSRASCSLVFSLALAVFSGVMFFGTGVHAKYPTHWVAALGVALAGTGILVAGSIPTFSALIVGFGVIFGASIGIGYGIAVGTANMAKTNKGLITGLIVAAFATTPVFLAPILRASVLSVGPHATFQLVGKVILAMAPVVWACFYFGKVQIPMPSKLADDEAVVPFKTVATIFAAFGTGCLGGLMTIAHATGIVASFGGTAVQAGMAVQYGALGNYFGRILAGATCDILGPKVVLFIAATGAAVCLLAANTMFASSPLAAIVAVIVCGVGYGCSMTSYAVLTRKMVGGAQFGKYFGKVFLGYGMGAFAGPLLAGYLFDKTGGYTQPIFVAAMSCMLTAVLLLTLPKYKE